MAERDRPAHGVAEGQLERTGETPAASVARLAAEPAELDGPPASCNPKNMIVVPERFASHLRRPAAREIRPNSVYLGAEVVPEKKRLRATGEAMSVRLLPLFGEDARRFSPSAMGT